MHASLIDVIETAYDVDSKEDRWLAAIVRASKPVLDDGFGVFAFTYDASVPERMGIDHFARTRNHAFFDAGSALAGIQAAGGGDYVKGTFRSLSVSGTRSTPGFAGSDAERLFDANGLGDLLVINGLDPAGFGVCIGSITKRRVVLTGADRERYARVATHLANSRRLRRRLSAQRSARRVPWDADAILTPRGRLEHAASPDTQLRHGREVLRRAAVAVDRARGKLRRVDADAALGGWTALVDGRWSLVDKFDSDGKHYVLARRNEPTVRGLESLSERERAVAAYAALGHSNKLIAYDLGIAHSTVRVLLARAAAKLGVRTRDQLVARIQQETATKG